MYLCLLCGNWLRLIVLSYTVGIGWRRRRLLGGWSGLAATQSAVRHYGSYIFPLIGLPGDRLAAVTAEMATERSEIGGGIKIRGMRLHGVPLAGQLGHRQLVGGGTVEARASPKLGLTMERASSCFATYFSFCTYIGIWSILSRLLLNSLQTKGCKFDPSLGLCFKEFGSPDPLIRGFAAGPHWGLRTPDSRYRLALCACHGLERALPCTVQKLPPPVRKLAMSCV